MATPTANTSKFSFEVKNLDAELRVAALHGEEGMSRLFQFELELVSEDPEIDFASVVNQPAVITVEGQDETRHIHGIVQRFEQGEQGDRFTHYHAWLVPKLWWLGNRQDCRIFQDENVQDIIEAVLKGAGLTHEDYKFSLDETYPKRDYCVQFRETDLAFIERLMQEEGIFYYFEHDDQKHTLVMGDSSSAYGVVTGSETIPFVPPTGAVSDEEHVTKFRYTEGVTAGEVVLRDYNFKKPGTNLEVTEDADQYTELSVYDYPGEYEETDRGKTIKQIRMEELIVERIRAGGTTGCPRLIPGHKFTLDKHPRNSFNQGYLITAMVHDGKEPQALEEEGGNEIARYSNDFNCIPIDVVFRPGRKIPKPVMDGPQTAIVVGPKGEEIYTDDFGRVKVQFHWDRLGKRDENSSCWIRVSQAWAGGGWGAMFIPRVGHEVVVDYISGDPDQPIITGSVYHGTNRHQHHPKEKKTKSAITSSSMNEISFDDKNGEEEIYLHAIRNLREDIDKDHTINVLGERKDTIKGDLTQTITEGKIDISADKGKIDITAKSDDISLTADSGDIDIEAKAKDVSVTAFSGIDMTATTKDIEMTATLGEIKMTALKGVSVISPKGLEAVTGKVFETGGHKQEAFGFTYEAKGMSVENVGLSLAYNGISMEHTMLKIESTGMSIERKPIVIYETETELKIGEVSLKQAVLHLLI